MNIPCFSFQVFIFSIIFLFCILKTFNIYYSRILPADNFRNQVLEIAKNASQLSAEAISQSKSLIVRELKPRLLEANKLENELLIERFMSDDFARAVQAFLGELFIFFT